MKKSLLTSGFLFGLISFSLGQVSKKKVAEPLSTLRNEKEIRASKKEDLKKVAEFKTNPAYIPIITEQLQNPKKEESKKLKLTNK